MNKETAGVRRESGGALLLFMDIVMAACMAFALVLDLNVRSGSHYINWAASLPGTPVVAVLFGALLLGARKARQKLPPLGMGTWLLCLFLGFWWVLVQSVANTQDIRQPFLTLGQMLKTVVMTMGMGALYHLLFRLLVYALDRGRDWNIPIHKEKAAVRALTRGYQRHTVLSCMLLLLTVWLPHFVIAFPCAMNSDAVFQLYQWTGLSGFTSHHPPFGTLLIGLAYDAGLLLGDGGWGLALYVAVQMICVAAVIGYAQKVMRLLHTPQWLRVLALLAACFCPVYCDNVTTIIKDVPYACGMLLIMSEAARILFVKDEKMTCAAALRLLIGTLFVMLMRNNGKFVMIPLVLALAVLSFGKRRLRMVACMLLAAMLVSRGIDAWMIQTFDIAKGSRAEALSLPFQQTARYVRDHEQEITQEEYDAIEAVLGMSNLGGAYDPVISDPVKGRFRADVDSEDLQRYFAVWFKQFLKDPLCYVKATLIQNILLLDPQTYNLAMFAGTGIPDERKELLHISEPETFYGLRAREGEMRQMLMSLPGMAQLNSVGFHCCVLLFICLFALKYKHGGMLMMVIPILVSMMVIVAGPCLQNQDRYGFPIIYCMPILLSCMSVCLRKNHEASVVG